jgi:hypothetical protein
VIGEDHTSVECTANGSDDDLETEQSAHAAEDGATLVVDSVDTDNMDGRAGGEEDGGTDRLEEEEFLTCLYDALAA